MPWPPEDPVSDGVGPDENPLLRPLRRLAYAAGALYESFLPEQKPHILDGPLAAALAALAPYRSPCVVCAGRGCIACASRFSTPEQFCTACNVAFPDAEDDFGIINGYCAACSRDLTALEDEK